MFLEPEAGQCQLVHAEVKSPLRVQTVATQLGYRHVGLAKVTARVLGAVLPKPKKVRNFW